MGGVHWQTINLQPKELGSQKRKKSTIYPLKGL